MRSLSSRRLVPYGPLLLLAVLASAGCGRPATPQDCERIIEQVTVLELQQNQVSDPQAVADFVAQAQAAFKDAAAQHCVGKRITDGALQCIAQATKTEEVFEDCLD